jgi:probable O-glycosylation ligase (exosortase A-associated)
MRELLLSGIVGVLCVAGIFRPQIGLFGYIWFALMRPDVLAWVYGENRYSFFLAVATLLGAAFRAAQSIPAIVKNRISVILLLMQVPIILSSVFAVDPSLAFPSLWLYLRVVAMSLLIVLLFRELASFRYLLLVMAGSLGMLGAKFGVFGVLHGGVRFAQGYGGMMSDNNAFALAFAMAVPLCWYARSLVTSRLAKIFFMGLAIANIPAVVMSFSRGGAVSLAVGLFMIWIRSKRKVVTLFAVVMISAPVILMVGSTYSDRISTILNPTQEASANSRIVLAEAALRMWMDHPVLGVGYGRLNEQALILRYIPLQLSEAYASKVIHNTYMQILCDCGVFAFLLYALLLFGSIYWMGRSVKRMRAVLPEMEAYPAAIQSALIAFAVGATFLSRVEFDLMYFLVTAGAAWLNIESALIAQARQTAGPPAMNPPAVSRFVRSLPANRPY